MSNYVILSDTACDLDEQFQKDYDIQVIPAHYKTPDGEEHDSFLNWEKQSREDFYKKLKANPEGFTTAPASVEELTKWFEGFVEAGKDIIFIAISTGLSGTYNFACAARDQVLAKHPDAKIAIVDSLRFGPAIGMICVYASDLRKEGKTLEETVAWIEENKNRFHQSGWLDDLSFVAKKGRITNAKAFFGQLAGIKPIGEFDYNGMTTVICNVKGAKKAHEVLMKYIGAVGENFENQVIWIAQSNRMKQAIEYKKLLEDTFHPKAVIIKDVFPTNGINVGPGLMAAYYMGKPISKGLVEERKILDAATAK